MYRPESATQDLDLMYPSLDGIEGGLRYQSLRFGCQAAAADLATRQVAGLENGNPGSLAR